MLLVRQIRYENRAFWRNPAAAFFTFAFPLIFMVVFQAIFGDQVEDDGLTAADVLHARDRRLLDHQRLLHVAGDDDGRACARRASSSASAARRCPAWSISRHASATRS